jgi:hypothetical protein
MPCFLRDYGWVCAINIYYVDAVLCADQQGSTSMFLLLVRLVSIRVCTSSTWTSSLEPKPLDGVLYTSLVPSGDISKYSFQPVVVSCTTFVPSAFIMYSSAVRGLAATLPLEQPECRRPDRISKVKRTGKSFFIHYSICTKRANCQCGYGYAGR